MMRRGRRRVGTLGTLGGARFHRRRGEIEPGPTAAARLGGETARPPHRPRAGVGALLEQLTGNLPELPLVDELAPAAVAAPAAAAAAASAASSRSPWRPRGFPVVRLPANGSRGDEVIRRHARRRRRGRRRRRHQPPGAVRRGGFLVAVRAVVRGLAPGGHRNGGPRGGGEPRVRGLGETQRFLHRRRALRHGSEDAAECVVWIGRRPRVRPSSPPAAEPAGSLRVGGRRRRLPAVRSERHRLGGSAK